MTETFGDGAAAVRESFASVMSKGADAATELGGKVAESSYDLLRTVTKAVKRNPLTALAIAFGGGAFIAGGVLLYKRWRR
jgi:ElaB/YqjD/DUF883 family membrane-anchored ribosome-binding protein